MRSWQTKSYTILELKLPKLFPFKAITPKSEYASEVCANSAHFNSDEELKAHMRNHPNSFLRLTKNHLLNENIGPISEEFFKNAKAYISQLLDSQVLSSFNDDIFVVYRQSTTEYAHTGVIGLCDIKDYIEGRILKHEHTRPTTESFVSSLMESTQIIGEPLLLSHHHKQSLEDLLRFVIQEPVELEFHKHGKTHQFWYIESKELVEAMKMEVSSVGNYYIMDGHHRAASVAKLYQEKKADAYRHCLTYLVDSNQLVINAFHRFVEDDSIQISELMGYLSHRFEVEEIAEYIVHPEGKGEFILICEHGNFRLTLKERQLELDVQELELRVLETFFDVADSRLDDRISFIAVEEEVQDAIQRAKQPGKYLFMLHPCSFEDVARISDKGEFMPPKSTYVHPKCDSGIVLQSYGV